MTPRDRVSEIAALMEEFRLSEARYEDAGVTIAFKRRTNSRPKATSIEELAESEAVFFDEIV
ncbi:hypothetical protein, partial [Pseudomonas sp. GW460-C8]|uniref:hypothetical protein n=1 Tax=Pseudomonas sp. GW460-C8 TaxID=2070589 RepID=UPI001C4840AB